MAGSFINFTEFAKRAGADESQANKFLVGKLGKGARVSGKVDLAHPGVAHWMNRRRLGIKGNLKKAEREKVETEIEEYIEACKVGEEVVDEDDYERQAFQEEVSAALRQFDKYLNMTLEQIIRKHGTDRMFKDFLSCAKSIEDITEKRLKNHERSGGLISREFVRTGIFMYLDTLNVRVLNDAPRTITGEVYDRVKAKESLESIEDTVRSLLTDHMRGVKTKVSRKIREAGNAIE